MEGQLFLAYLLQEMIQNQLSGYIYYHTQGGKGGKIFFTQGVLCSLSYQGLPISASALATLKVNKAVLLQNISGPAMPSPETPDATSVLQALRQRQ